VFFVNEGLLEKFLPVIFNLLDKGYSKAKIAKELKISSQKIQYWFKKLEKQGFVKRTLRSSTIIYERQQKTLLNGSKKILGGSDKALLTEQNGFFQNLHHYRFQFEVVKWAGLPFSSSFKTLKHCLQFEWNPAREGRDLGWRAWWFNEVPKKVFFQVGVKFPISAKQGYVDGVLEAVKWAGFVEQRFGIELGKPVAYSDLIHFSLGSNSLSKRMTGEKVVFEGSKFRVDDSLRNGVGECEVVGAETAVEFENLLGSAKELLVVPKKIKDLAIEVEVISKGIKATAGFVKEQEKLFSSQQDWAFAVQESFKAVNGKLDLLIEELREWKNKRE
jgi:biotin operon repressor